MQLNICKIIDVQIFFNILNPISYIKIIIKFEGEINS